jgi:hypothetical protein
MTTWGEAARTTLRLLTFRSSREELLKVGWKHLAFGLLCTWLVGMGRYWDNPRVGLLQHAGIGSVLYVFVLSTLLWLIVLPLKPKDWSYFRVCTFVSLVSPPATLYAIPVEKLFDLDTANSINAWFLAIVAVWRVSLLVFFLRRLAQLHWFAVITATLLPLILITVTLVALNLEKVVMDLMGGRHQPSPNDSAYSVLFLLSLLSMLLSVPVALCYLVMVVQYQVVDRSIRKKELE